jgi:hypothetical protein
MLLIGISALNRAASRGSYAALPKHTLRYRDNSRQRPNPFGTQPKHPPSLARTPLNETYYTALAAATCASLADAPSTKVHLHHAHAVLHASPTILVYTALIKYCIGSYVATNLCCFTMQPAPCSTCNCSPQHVQPSSTTATLPKRLWQMTGT